MTERAGFLTTQQVAKRLGVTPRRVRYMIVSGDLLGELVAGRMVVSRDSLATLLRYRRRLRAALAARPSSKPSL
jgi:hypothetical protein